MTHRTSALIAGVVLVAGAAATGAMVPDGQQTFRARTDVISVPVTVTRGREPVIGLTAADFELTDNGEKQVVEVAAAGDVPLDLTIVLSEFSFHGRDEHRRAIASADAVRDRLAPVDRLRLIFIDHQVRGVLPDRNYRVATDPTAQELQWGRGTATGFVVSPSELRTQSNQEHGFGIALVDGLFYALAWPVAADRRHLVVAFTDGHDTASTLEASRLPSLAARSDAVLHAVLWTTPGEGPSSGLGWVSRDFASNAPGWRESYAAIDTAVRRSGGSLHRIERARDTLAEIIDDSRSSYVLRFTPTSTPARGWHEVRARVTKPGSFTIRARQGYEY